MKTTLADLKERYEVKGEKVYKKYKRKMEEDYIKNRLKIKIETEIEAVYKQRIAVVNTYGKVTDFLNKLPKKDLFKRLVREKLSKADA